MKSDSLPVLIRNERPAERHSRHPRHLHPPLALKYVAAAVSNETGVDAVIIDNWLLRLTPSELCKAAMAHKPSMAVIEGNSSCIEESIELARMLSEHGLMTVATGQQSAHAAYQDCPGWQDAFDIPVLGEPEEIVPRLLQKGLSGGSVDELRDQCIAAFRKKEYFLVGAPDTLPQPVFSPEDLSLYKFPFPVRGHYAGMWGYVQTSWGCTHSDNCVFCSDMVRKSCGSDLRLRTASKVADEIESLIELGAEGICFEDNNLFNDKKNILALCEEIVRRGMKFPWVASVRADYCSDEVVEKVAGAGAVLLKVGVESASPRIIEMLDKSGSGEQWLKIVRDAFARFKLRDIGSVALVMIGCPGETEEEVQATTDLVLELEPDYIQAQMFSVYPDSIFFRQQNAEQQAEYSFTGDMNHYHVPEQTASKMKPERLLSLQQQMYRVFYLRAGFMMRHLARSWRYYLRPATWRDLICNVGGELLGLLRTKENVGYAAALVFVLVCLGIAAWSGATLSHVPVLEKESYPYSLSADLLMKALPPAVEHVRREGDGVTAYENVWFDYRIEIPSSGVVPLCLIAKGTPAAGCYPSVIIKVDGDFRDALFCTSDAWGLYRIPLDLSRGWHDINISYQNDGFHFPEDRDLGLKLVTVGENPESMASYYRWKAPLRIPAHKMSVQSYVEYKEMRAVLLGGGKLGDDVFFEAAGRYPVIIDYEYDQKPVGPLSLVLRLDGERIASQVVRSTGNQRFIAHINIASPGLHRLEVENEGTGDSLNDIVVSSLMIHGLDLTAVDYDPSPLYITEDETRLSHAGWAYCSGGAITDEEALLWSNGCLKKQLELGKGFKGMLKITARGEPADGVWPEMIVMIDNDQLKRINVNSAGFSEYECELNLAPGSRQLMLVFDNDGTDSQGGDRNLAVKGVTFFRKNDGS